MSRRPLCSWCGHPTHEHPCPREIHTGTRQPTPQPCPCNKNKENTNAQQH